MNSLQASKMTRQQLLDEMNSPERLERFNVLKGKYKGKDEKGEYTIDFNVDSLDTTNTNHVDHCVVCTMSLDNQNHYYMFWKIEQMIQDKTIIKV